MKILSFDCSGDSCAACIWADGRVTHFAEEVMQRGQDRRLVPLLISLLHDAGETFQSMDRIAVIRGPGSFTGLRIALATARGIGVATLQPVIGVDRFAIYAVQARNQAPLSLTVLSSKRNELFCEIREGLNVECRRQSMNIEEITNYLSSHPGCLLLGDIPIAGYHVAMISRSQEVAISAQLAAEADPGDAHFLPRPLYMREPDVTVRPPRIEAIRQEHLIPLAEIHRLSFPLSGWSNMDLEELWSLPTSSGWIALVNNAPAGFILLQSAGSAHEILTLCVEENYRRTGIARRLIEVCLSTLTKSGGSVMLDVAADNDSALKLYEKAGFKRVGNRRGYYRRINGAVDAVLLTHDCGTAPFAPN